MSLELAILFRVTAIFAITSLVVLALRRASAATRHTLWGVGFLAALILPIGLVTLPVIKLPLLAPAPIDTVSAVEPPAVAVSMEASAPPLRTGSVSFPAAAMAAPTVIPTDRSTTWEWRRLLQWLWVMGTLIAFLRLLLSNREVLRLKRLSRSDIPDDIKAEVETLKRELPVETAFDVRLGPHDVPPMTCGLFRQMILLPAAAVQWTAERRRIVLAHELAHARRRDGLTQAFVEIVCALYWFHPAVWLAARRMRVDRERACDDVVLNLGVNPGNYVDHLLSIAREINSRFSPVAVSMAHPWQLEARLRAILIPTARRRAPSRLVTALLVLTGVLVAAGLSSIQLTAGARAKAAERSTQVTAVESPGSQTVNPGAAQRPGSGTIVGQLRNIDGTPAVGVRVGAMVVNSTADSSAALVGFAETDSLGRFRIDGIRPGAYYVTAGLLELPTFYPGVKTAGEARSVQVTAGATVESIDFSLLRSAGVRVAGRVQNIPPGLPREAVRVNLQPVIGFEAIGTATAQPIEVAIRSDGTFEFARVAPGRYVPRVMIVGTFGAADAIVVDDRDVTGISITPPPLLVGQVEIAGGGTLPVPTSVVSGLALPDAASFVQILARRVNPRTLANAANTMEPANGNLTTTVRANGLFVLPADAGEYQLYVMQIPVGYYLRSVSAGNVDLTRNTLQIGSAPPADVRVVLSTQRPADAPPEFKLSGKLTGLPVGTPPSTRAITFTMSAPAADASITPAIRRIGEAQIHADGTFELLRVPPGSWSITVLDLAARIITRAQTIFVGDRDVANIEVVSLTAAPARAPVATAAGGAKLSGRVIAPNSSASLPTAVTLSLGPGGLRTAPVQPDGSFSFSDVPPGSGTLRTQGGFPYGPTGFTVSIGDRDVSEVQILLPELFDVRGRFTLDGATTLPAELSRLQLSAQYGNGSRNSIPQGGLIAIQLPAGTYNMSVLNLPTTYTVESISYGNVDIRATPLKVDAPLTSEIVVRIAPFAPRGAAPRVAGRVTNLPAVPYIQNPKIILTRDTNAGGGALETPMSKDGSFAFNAVPPGPYTVTTFGLTADFTSKLEVKDAEITDLTLPLAGLSAPIIPGASFAAVFSTRSEITLRGVITQTVTHPRANAPVAYIRMEILDAAGEPKSWAVALSVPRAGPPEQAAEIARLKVGARVVVVGNPANDGSNRVYLVPRAARQRLSE